MRGVVFLTVLYLLAITLPSLSYAHQEAPRQAQIDANRKTSTLPPDDSDYGEDEDIDETTLEPEEQTVTTYEWASFFPIGPNPPNATSLWNATGNANDKYVVVVKTQDKILTMEMSEVADSDYDNVEVVVIRPNGTETFKVSDKIRYFKGIVKELNNSRAHGIFRTNGLFEGIIETDTETYFVESVVKFFGNASIYSGALDENMAIIYRWQDLRQFPFETACNQKMLPCYYYQTMQHYRQLFPPDEILEARHGTDAGKTTTRKRQTGKTCPMTIVADHRFFQQVGSGSIHKALEAIVWHIEEVDHLYRQADWNNDKAPDRIGVSLDRVIIYTDASSPGNAFKDDTKDDEVFLKRFAGVNTTGSCVAAVFTFSDLGGTFGISYVGTVCAPKYNWALINFRNVDGAIRQRAASVITIMHEVAHVFGANHDENETRCLPAGQNNGADNGGNYIMYPTSAFGLYDNNHKFSPCSVEAIAKNFQDAKRTRCMIDRSPTKTISRRRRATKRDILRIV